LDPSGDNQVSLAQPPKKVYSVPRRYDIATLLAVTLAYALLFGMTRLFQWQPVDSLVVAGFLTAVGVGQAVLFHGKSPRAASAIVGAFLHAAPVLAMAVIQPGSPFDLILIFTICLVQGAIFGYVAGVLVAGVFLVAHGFRAAVRRLKGRRA
jgi:hypothetical protein